MPCGLVRTDLNITGINYLHGFPITLPHDFGNDVLWIVSPAHFGNPIPPINPTFNSNPVNWVVNPAHFGNIIGQVFGNFLLQEYGISLFELEDGSGFILLEN